MDLRDAAYRKQKSVYVGNNYQLGGTRHYQLTQGRSDGCRCIDVKTGGGLEYTIVCDRGMDLSLASWRGINLVFLTENAEAHPSFYDARRSEWLRTFTAGLMTTCGPSYLGDPCEDEGEPLGLHGRYSTIPAFQVCDETDYEEGVIRITGRMTESHPFGDKLLMKRTIESEFGGSAIKITDNIRNMGDRDVPLTILYHVNFGYPFVTESAQIHVQSVHCEGYDEYSQERMNERFHMKCPDAGNFEKNYLHTFAPQEKSVCAWIRNGEIPGALAVYLRFSPQELPYMTQWMLENARDFVAALEPANVPCTSRSELRKQNLLPVLKPGEMRELHLEIGVLEGDECIRSRLG